MPRSTINLTSGDVSPAYTSVITKLRVYRLEDVPFGDNADLEDEWPWQIDGIDTRTYPYRVTADVENYRTHADAIAALPDFAAGYVFLTSSIIPDSSVQLIDSARSLIEDGASDNYLRALVDLIHDFEPWPGVEGGDDKRAVIETELRR